ncbi:MAG: hypothetical protein LQ351_003741 [Letrouitia transgressa]|nr:MAG: hypothetical protein LQ351_003741 [Letrouitia transgressa]
MEHINELLDARPEAKDELQQMQDLVRQYGFLPPPPFGIESISSRSPGPRRHVVLLTGVTAAFGCHVLGHLSERQEIEEVICLVRGRDNEEAMTRVLNSLKAYGQNGFSTPGPESMNQRTTLTCIAFNPDTLDLGLSREVYQGIAARVTHIGHMAWRLTSKLNSPLESHIGDIKALNYFLTLAASFPRGQAPPRVLFASSTSAVANTPSVEYPIREGVSTNPEHAAPLSYSRSKWVAEGICSTVHHNTRLKNHIWVLRVGQLCGNVEQGVWDLQEPWSAMIAAIQKTSAMPTLKGERIDWLPVDVAAKVARHIGSWRGGIKDWDGQCPVFHLVNQSTQVTGADLLRWIQSIEWDSCETLPPIDWLRRVETLDSYPKSWVDVWRIVYGKIHTSREIPFYETWKTAKASAQIEHPRQIRENHFRRMWEWIKYQMQHLDQ